MSIQTDDLQNVSMDGQLLDSNLYDWKVVAASITEREKGKDTFHSLFIQAECIGGPEQQDGSDPEGVKASVFFPLDGYETMKDQGIYVKSRLKAFLTAVLGELDGSEVDEKDLVGEEFKARIGRGKDIDGDATMEFKKFMPA